MGEIEKEVKTYSIRYFCDECKEGEMKPTGVVLTSNPPQYPHMCNKCEVETIFFGKQYPIIITR